MKNIDEKVHAATAAIRNLLDKADEYVNVLAVFLEDKAKEDESEQPLPKMVDVWFCMSSYSEPYVWLKNVELIEAHDKYFAVFHNGGRKPLSRDYYKYVPAK